MWVPGCSYALELIRLLPKLLEVTDAALSFTCAECTNAGATVAGCDAKPVTHAPALDGAAWMRLFWLFTAAGQHLNIRAASWSVHRQLSS
jgi:hypothetical protein